LRGEYIFGEHPGTSTGAYTFRYANFASVPAGPVFMRKINGGYVLLAQDFGTTPFTAVIKYDWYNPNTEVSGNEIGAADFQPLDANGNPIPNTNITSGGAPALVSGDITMSSFAVGLIVRISPQLRLTAYYDMVKNETTEHIKDIKNADNKITVYGYEGNRPANVFTMRLQYRF